MGFKVPEPHARPSDSLSLAVSCQSRCATLSSFSNTMAACACYASCIDYNRLLFTIEQFFTRLILPIQILGSLSISFSFFLWWFAVFTVKVFCLLDRFIPTFLGQLWMRLISFSMFLLLIYRKATDLCWYCKLYFAESDQKVAGRDSAFLMYSIIWIL